jgi:hypothetical protein
LTDVEERRAKREARRAKQRIENVGRAAKMHDARLTWERSANRAPPSTDRPAAGIPRRMFGMVLLALARRLLRS